MKRAHMRRGPHGRGQRAEWRPDELEAHLARHDGFPGSDFGPGPGPRRGRGGTWAHGGPGGHRRGGRARGDVRGAIIALLAEEPRHGYDLIRAIEERSGGTWVPSPGSIYPTLQALEDEGIVAIEMIDGRKTASLTAAGRAHAQEHAEAHARLFETNERTESAIKLRREMGELRDAAIHVARRPDRPDLADKAVEILAAARRDLYRLLADEN